MICCADYFGSSYHKQLTFGGQLSIIIALARQAKENEIITKPDITNSTLGEINDGIQHRLSQLNFLEL